MLLAQLPAATERLVVACSGGMDSLVLLDLAQRTGRPVHVVHVHHGLQSEADAWAAHVAAVARQKALSYEILSVQPKPKEGGVEAAARQARYAALCAVMQSGDCLLTGHHADDQAETLLLRMLRGTGPLGLAGIRHCQRFGAGWLLRPLLNTPYTALCEYAVSQQLQWRDDPSNQELSYERNYLRHTVMPLLQSRWPAAQQCMGRLAALSAEMETVLSELLTDRLAAYRVPGCGLLSVSKLQEASPPMRHALVRHWIAESGWRPPTENQLREGLNSLLFASSDRQPILQWKAGQIARFNNALYRLPRLLPVPPLAGTLQRGQTSHWGSVGSVVWPREAQPEQPDVLWLRPFQPGDRLRVLKRPARGVKHFFREAGVPPWWRRRLPVVVDSCSEPVAVAGIAPEGAFEFVPNSDPEWGDWGIWHA